MINPETVIVKIYELRDPRDPECKPRYVGITTKSLKKRLSSHIISRNVNSNHKNNWIKSLLKDGIKPSVHLIEEVIGWKYACEVEKYWIKEFKEQGYKLTNSTDGGEGVLGLILSEDSLKRMATGVSKANKGKIPSNLESLRDIVRRPILEYENNLFVREYKSCKEAGEILNIDYKTINNILRKKVSKLRKYPNKTWVYKDKKEVNIIKRNPKSGWRKNIFKRVVQTTLDGEIIATFSSIDEAAQILNLSRNTIINSCNSITTRCIKLNCKFKYE